MAADAADSWRPIVASALDWQEAHVPFDAAVADLPAGLRGRRPPGLPHSTWELVEHVRRTQADLVEFMVNADYSPPAWPADYWPASPDPTGEAEWGDCVAGYRRDRQRLRDLALRPDLDLTARIPWGEGQTYLRTILVAVDHAAYHVGQIVVVRRLLGAWPGA